MTHRPQLSLTFDAAAGERCAALRWVYDTCERLLGGADERELFTLDPGGVA